MVNIGQKDNRGQPIMIGAPTVQHSDLITDCHRYRQAEGAQLTDDDVAAGKAAWQQLQEAMAAEGAAMWLDPGGGSHRHSLWQLLTESLTAPGSKPMDGMEQGSSGAGQLFVETPSTVINLQRLLVGLCRQRPMLVKGPPGASLLYIAIITAYCCVVLSVAGCMYAQIPIVSA